MNAVRVQAAVPAIAAAFATALGSADLAQAQSARDTSAAGPGAARVENWLVAQRSTEDSAVWKYWPRFYIPFELPRGATFTQRIDLQVAYTDSVGPQNPAGTWKAGIGDWFIEEIFTTPTLVKDTTLVASVRFVFPTGGLAPFGSAQHQWAPAVGVRYAMPDRGVTFSPLARYFMSVHATNEAAQKVRTLDLFPTVTLDLDAGWSLSFYSENPIAYNAVAGKWFVPVDVLMLRRLSKTVDFTFGGAYGVIRDAPLYKYVVNASLAVYF